MCGHEADGVLVGDEFLRRKAEAVFFEQVEVSDEIGERHGGIRTVPLLEFRKKAIEAIEFFELIFLREDAFEVAAVLDQQIEKFNQRTVDAFFVPRHELIGKVGEGGVFLHGLEETNAFSVGLARELGDAERIEIPKIVVQNGEELRFVFGIG